MTSLPNLISVIIPVYNGAAFLADAFETVLRQACAPLEIIVVDDGSTDETASILRGYGDRLTPVYQSNQGPPAARNHGLALAQGEFIAFLDADDLWHEDKLAVQLERLMADGALQVVLGHTQFVQQAKVPIHGVTYIGKPCPQLFLGSALFRRAAFEKVDIFDITFRYCDDWDWFLRAQYLHLRMEMYPEVVLYYRRHQHNLTRSPQSRQELLRLLRRSLHRQREEKHSPLPEWFNSVQRRLAHD